MPLAPPTQAFVEPDREMLSLVKQQYELDVPFALYPAMTWQHKNHIRLMEALLLLRDKHSIKLNLVCTGHKTDFWPEIKECIRRLDLEQQVKFPGMVPADELRSFYKLASFVVVPTLFEAASGPLFEAWQEGTPVACSTVTSLPEQARDGALFFDPYSAEAMANALLKMTQDENLRKHLSERGANRLRDFCWERTAKAYRAVYRRAAGRPITEEDQQYLEANRIAKSAEGKAI